MVERAGQDDAAEKMLAAVFKETGGEPGRTVGMWAVGEALGLDRAGTEDTAMGLVTEGLLEIKSLSGGVSLTEAGLARSAFFGTDAAEGTADLAAFIARVESDLGGLGLDLRSRKDLEMDLATLKAQNERSRPLPAVIESTIAAVRETLASSPRPAARRLLDELSRLES